MGRFLSTMAFHRLVAAAVSAGEGESTADLRDSSMRYSEIHEEAAEYDY